MTHLAEKGFDGFRLSGLARGTALVFAGWLAAMVILAPQSPPRASEGLDAASGPVVIEDWRGNSASFRPATGR